MNTEVIFTEKGMVKRKLLESKDKNIQQLLDNIFSYTGYHKLQKNIKNATRLLKYPQEELICKHEDCNNRVFINNGTNKKNDYCSNKCASSSLYTLKKREATCIEKYGCKNPLQNEDIRKKREATCIEKYGCKNPLQNEDIRKKREATMIMKYGIAHPLQNKDIKSKINYKIGYKIEDDYQFIIDNFVDDKFMISKFKNYYSCSSSTAYLTINRLGIKYPKIGISEKEKMVQQMFNSYNCDFNTKKLISPFEVDIYFKDYNFAIEYNGIYWHRYQSKKDKFRHQQKALLLKELDIQLIHIYEEVNEYMLTFIPDMISSDSSPGIPGDDIIIIDLDYDNGNWLESDYDLIEILEPQIIPGLKYIVYNSGYLKYKRKIND